MPPTITGSHANGAVPLVAGLLLAENVAVCVLVVGHPLSTPHAVPGVPVWVGAYSPKKVTA